MATPLHPIAALTSLAETAQGPARDWASARLAVMAPEDFSRYPASLAVPDVVVAARPPRLVSSLVAALQSAEPVPESLASAVAALSFYGALPEDPAPLARASREALRGDGSDADAWLLLGLAHLGALTRDELRLGAACTSPVGHLALSVAVLRLAEQEGELDEAAAAVAEELRARASHEPDLLQAVLTALGCPLGSGTWPTKDPAEAAWAGCAAAGGTRPALRVGPGSLRRRTQAWVQGLLDGIPGPAAALLRHAFAKDPAPGWGLPMVGVAGWLHAFTPGDPIEDVLQRFAGADPAILSAARRAVGPAHREAVLDALRSRPDPAVGSLALELLAADPSDHALASATTGLLLDHRALDLRAEAAACVAAWRCPERIPPLLSDPLGLDLGLLLAEWVPTEEVLAALLELRLPLTEERLYPYAMCLASMGDQAALPTLQALLGERRDPHLEPVRALVLDLLGVEL